MRPEPEESEFVVEIDRDAVFAARRTTLRVKLFSASVTTAGGALVVAMLVLIGIDLAGKGEGPGTLLAAAFLGIPGLMLLIVSWREFTAYGRLRDTWSAMDPPAVAMRMSVQGLRCSIDAAPDHVFLPWSAVTGFQVKAVSGQRFLVLGLTPDLTPSTPGVSGLDHPDVQRVLHRKVLGIRGLRFAVSTLRRPIEEMDEALAHFTQGRVRINA